MKYTKSPTRFVKAKNIDATFYNATSNIYRKDLVHLIAQISKDNLDLNDVKKRVSQKINYHVKNGKLSGPVHKCFVFGDVMRWVQQEWPGKFDNLPVTSITRTGVINVAFPSMTSKAYGVALPADIQFCHSEITRLAQENFKLKEQLSLQKLENSNLRPDAEKYRQIVIKNTKNGKKGGRGKAK